MPSYFLFVFNIVLLAASWIMLIYAYPRLPSSIPLWLSFGGSNFLYPKSFVIFLYPFGETLFNLLFIKLARVKIRWPGKKSPIKKTLKVSLDTKIPLREEFALLALIFFNLIFIHIERSLILIAHQVEKGVNSFYFMMLFLVLIMLIPYYRIRELVEKKHRMLEPGQPERDEKGIKK